jgi:glycosyltransferase involved in cell wall biosynthesis
MVNYEYPPLGGGGGVAMQQMVRRLGDLHETAVLTSRARGAASVEMEGNAVIHRAAVLGRHSRAVASMTSMFSFLPAGVWRGIFAIRHERPDLINTWFAIPSGPTGVLLSRIFKIPHVLTMIGGDIYDPSKWYSPHRNVVTRSVVRWTMEHSRWLTTWSNDVRERALQLFGREVPIEVLPMGIDPPEFAPVERSALGMDRDAYYAVSIGRLIRRKRFDLLVDRFALSADPNVRLLILGEGPEEERIRERIAAHGLESRVKVPGAVWGEQKFQYLSNSDVYVSVASHEGFGLVFLEAMACGLPVLATPVGGQSDILIHGRTGYVLEHDADDLARRIHELFNAPEETIAMREFNRRHAQSFFMENIADLWGETFERYKETAI